MFIKPEAATCVKTALTKRGVSTKTAMSDHQVKILATVDARVACATSALDKTTAQDQSEANQICSTADKKSMQDNEAAFNTLMQQIQKTFHNDMKQCIGTPSAADASPSHNDTNSDITHNTN